MKFVQILLFTLFLISCKNSDTEIDAVISAVIKQDSLPILKKDSVALLNRLKKFQISTYKKDDHGNIIPIPPEPNTVHIENLLYMSVDKKMFFVKKDSSFISQQQKSARKISIPKGFESKVTITGDSLFYRKHNVEYFEIYEPIFSKDGQKAYTEVKFHKQRFGTGFAFLMQKINGKWEVIQIRRTWIT